MYISFLTDGHNHLMEYSSALRNEASEGNIATCRHIYCHGNGIKWVRKEIWENECHSVGGGVCEMPWFLKISVSVARISVLKNRNKTEHPFHLCPIPHYPHSPLFATTHLHFVNASEVLMKWEQLSATREKKVCAWVTRVWSDADD